MNTISTNSKIKLTDSNKKTLKKMINIVLLIFTFILIYYFIISSFLTYDKYIAPMLKGTTDAE